MWDSFRRAREIENKYRNSTKRRKMHDQRLENLKKPWKYQ